MAQIQSVHRASTVLLGAHIRAQSVSAIYSFVLAMTLHPKVQKRAQEEIDAVVGSDRLPAFDDRPNLPYLEAIVKEVLRWNPVAPLGTLGSVPRLLETG